MPSIAFFASIFGLLLDSMSYVGTTFALNEHQSHHKNAIPIHIEAIRNINFDLIHKQILKTESNIHFRCLLVSLLCFNQCL